MPFTYEGIGTKYFGQKDRRWRTGQCRNCGFQGTLGNYNTRLWFVIFYIPVFPLGHKKIVDECPKCRQHFAFDPLQYDTLKETTISEAVDQFRENPTAETALMSHASILWFHDRPEAENFRTEAFSKVQADGPLLLGFAQQLEEADLASEAVLLIEAAHRLEPANLHARTAVAHLRMNAGEVDEARELLNHLEVSNASRQFSLAPLVTLAESYQKQQRHEDALQIFQHILTEQPELGQDHAFRKKVAASEKRIGTAGKVLPQRQGSVLQVFKPANRSFSSNQRTFAYLAVIAVLLTIGIAGYSEYVRRHRTLHIVSGLPGNVTGQVDDGPPRTMSRHERLTVAEGEHRVRITEPFQAEYTISMNASFWDRISKSPVWVVNIAGTAPLVQTDHIYAVKPPPSAVTHFLGQTSACFPDIDYAFLNPPAQEKVKNHETTITKTSVTLETVAPEQAFSLVDEPEAELNFLEAHLAFQPENSFLLSAYNQTVLRNNAIDRAIAYLQPGLTRRPVQVDWHRQYQELQEQVGRRTELVTLYDAALQKEPDDGNLIYLRGRLELDPDKQAQAYESAARKAPQSPWPKYSLAYQSINRGDWQDAKTFLDEAEKRNLPSAVLESSRYLVRLGLRDTVAIAAECRAALTQNPLDIPMLLRLFDALECSGNSADSNLELKSWLAQRKELPPNSFIPRLIKSQQRYYAGDLKGMERELGTDKSEPLNSCWEALWTATVQPEKISGDPKLSASAEDPWSALQLSVAFDLAGNNGEATQWREKSLAALKSGSFREQQAGQMLAANQPPPFPQVKNLILERTQKLVFLCALSRKFKSLEQDCNAHATRLNVSRCPPHQFVKRVFAKPDPPAK